MSPIHHVKSCLVPSAANLISKSLTFKRVTRRSTIETHFPLPLLPLVLVGAVGRLEHTNNLGNLETDTPIWSHQGFHYTFIIEAIKL